MEQLTAFTQELLYVLSVDGDAVLLGNTLATYALTVFIFLLALAICGLGQYFLLSLMESLAGRTKTGLDDSFIKMIRSFHPPFYVFLSVWIASRSITISGVADSILTGVLALWIVYQVTIVVGILVEEVLFQHVTQDDTTKSALHMLANIAKGILWAIGILFVLSNFGINVTSLLAGAGIAGVAIAFALQGILGDLFSSFSIYFDKPFKVGDFIIVGDTKGTVRNIGIKSTRIASLSGEEITVSNKELTTARINNFTRMQERRIVLTFGLVYETPIAQVRVVPDWIRSIVENVEGVRFDRAHFREFGESGLMFEAVYFVLSDDYLQYMNAQQSINLMLMERLAEEGIAFAYPTHTVYVTASHKGDVRGID